MKRLVPVLLAACLASPVVAEEDAVADAIVGYMDFATEAEGIILPQQLTEDVFNDVFFVDVRSPDSHATATIKGAVNIDWREVPGRLAELPEAGMVVLFCDTGVRSSQAAFAARVMGRTNVLVMQSGFQGWLVDGAYRPE
ncbi:rhodanese-like domain-containing protein [Shimia sp. SDUM112013]|uniref:rhodanese-like domain-containing protein n=1 Tax=Shimia sp. SDUM112013 TaxID=3136160 RepID=UPI0032EBED53